MLKKIGSVCVCLLLMYMMMGFCLAEAKNEAVHATVSIRNPYDKLLDEEMQMKVVRKVRISWDIVPDAVMYDLVIVTGKLDNKDHIVTTKHNIYTNGYELDTSVYNVDRDNLYWKIQGLDYNGKPVSRFTELKPLNEQETNTTSPKPTTEFEKMDYTPLYPVYSWIPYLKAAGYEVQVYFDADNNPQTADPLLKKDWVTACDYYDERAYSKPGKYWWRVRANNEAGNPLSEWSPRSYFTVTNKNIQVAALGDSITHGGGAVSTPPGYLMYDWETYAGMPVLNLGFSGNTVEAMNERFESDVVPFKPKILVVLGGINNIRQGDSARQVIAGLNAIKDKCSKYKIIPVFVTIAPINPWYMDHVAGIPPVDGWGWEQYKANKWIMQQPYYVDITPQLTDWRGWLSDSLTTDGLHPDMEGKRIIGQAIGRYIKNKFPEMNK